MNLGVLSIVFGKEVKDSQWEELQRTRIFNIFIEENNFMEIPLSNVRFTWSSEGEVICKSLVDRFLVSNKRKEAFEKRKTFSTCSLSTVMLKIVGLHYLSFLASAGFLEKQQKAMFFRFWQGQS